GHREAGRSADRHDDRDAGHGGFLHDLEARPSAHREDLIGERYAICEKGLSNDLVDRVVPSDVLSHTLQVPAGIEEAGGMQASRFGEERLFLAESLRNRPNRVGIDPRNLARNWMTGRHADRVEGSLPTDSARGGPVEMAAQPVR